MLRSPATAFWQAATIWYWRRAPSIQSLWRTGESPMRQSCLFRADGGSARDRPQHPGNAVTSRGRRVLKSYRYRRRYPYSSAFSRVMLRLRMLGRRKHVRLVYLRIDRRHHTVTFRNEGRCHELPKQGGRRRPESAGDHDVVPGSAVENVLRGAADDDVVSRAASQDTDDVTADNDVIAVTAIGGQRAHRKPRRLDDVVSAEAVDHDAIVGVEVRDRHRLGEARHRDHAVDAGDEDRIGTIGGVDDHRIRRTITGAVDTQVEIDLGDVGPGQVVDRDGIDATQRVELDVLNVVEVHGDGGDVAREPYAAAIGRDVDLLVDLRAVEQ